ncbi:response regulator transcription factor [Peterkaempfera griseoplana]|uniref:response regulator transcription factor n=1 Tax=Peterkaempfera griseoplana TaxID=66896 RepID=UPI0006E281CF|nr:helix-turn-helix transcriptional regulator [Peterkaempfera griseoplana]
MTNPAAVSGREVILPLPPPHLTVREIAILRLMAAGRPNTEIASALQVSQETLRKQVPRVLAGLCAEGRAHAAALGVVHGLVRPQDLELTQLPAPPALSQREAAVLRRIVSGASSQQIAQEMYFSAKTIHADVTRILEHLQARDRAHAAALAVLLDLVQLQDVDGRLPRGALGRMSLR